ncbi:hypothetical protein M3936_12440 [Sutcliffiella horikoshii]|uniref:hypothetical protein n=1 Tax=Sutcliffiella horikoshii TaxID=79883 RepID=UPI00203E875D|nr:hypothetical protein [Sutcliffiella horikoshii]MCM3618390.1 hypothetical protein [Sutcliffiella horikoshii]
MKQIKIGSAVMEVDVVKTKEFYSGYHSITDDCACDYCANFVRASDCFSEEVKELFASLGIDPRKEGELSHYEENADGTHFYSAFYHFVGRMMDVPLLSDKDRSSLTFLELQGVHIAFHEKLELVPEGFPVPTLQLEIQLNVPWMLEKESE